MNLFAYGTLMTAEGFVMVLGDRARVFKYRVARLPGWRRVWNVYREDWQGGVLNAEQHPEGVIVGVLVEGLTPEDLGQLDSQESTHLPRQTVVVMPEEGEAVTAEIYVCAHGNFQGAHSSRYQAAVLDRAAQAGPAVLESVRTGSVDASGRRRHLG